VEVVGHYQNPQTTRFVDGLPIMVCREPKVNLREAWAQSKPWD